jgi:hypothetical protein
MKKDAGFYNIQMRQIGIYCKVLTKVAVERRRKRVDWVTWLYATLHDEFDQFCKAKLKISSKMLLTLARNLVINSSHVFFTIGYFNPHDWIPILRSSILIRSNHFKTITIL